MSLNWSWHLKHHNSRYFLKVCLTTLNYCTVSVSGTPVLCKEEGWGVTRRGQERGLGVLAASWVLTPWWLRGIQYALYYTGVPYSSKVCLMPLPFYEKPTFSTYGNLRRVFIFMEKAKSRNCVQRVFCSSLTEAARTPQREARGLPPGNHTRHPSARPAALSCVCEHLCSILVYIVHY